MFKQVLTGRQTTGDGRTTIEKLKNSTKSYIFECAPVVWTRAMNNSNCFALGTYRVSFKVTALKAENKFLMFSDFERRNKNSYALII